MNSTIIGTGYVGLVTGASPTDLDNQVFCLDVNQAKIDPSPLFDLKSARV